MHLPTRTKKYGPYCFNFINLVPLVLAFLMSHGLTSKSFALTFDSGANIYELSDGSFLTVGATQESLSDSFVTTSRLLANGQLNLSYGYQGRAWIPFPDEKVNVVDSILLPDGKLCVLLSSDGFSGPTTRDTIFCKIDINGQLDTSFAGNGLYEVSFANEGIEFGAFVPNGTGFLLVGSTGPAGSTILRRLDENGAVDESFGTLGDKSFTGVSWISTAEDLANGKFFVGGLAGGILKFDANGDIDASFGTGGLVSEFATIYALHPLPDESLLVGEFIAANSSHLGKVDASGDLDPAFDSDGRVELADTGGPRPTSIDTDDMGEILVFLRDFSTNATGFALRFTADGSDKMSFGTNGTQQISPGIAGFTGNTRLEGSLQSDGKIPFVFTPQTQGGNSFAAGRLQADGTTDSTFGDAGFTEISYDITLLDLSTAVKGRRFKGNGIYSRTGANQRYKIRAKRGRKVRFRVAYESDGVASSDIKIRVKLRRQDFDGDFFRMDPRGKRRNTLNAITRGIIIRSFGTDDGRQLLALIRIPRDYKRRRYPIKFEIFDSRRLAKDVSRVDLLVK